MQGFFDRLHALQEPLARVPLLAAKEVVYDRGYFADLDARHARAYELFADALADRLEPATAVDVGCGTGRLLARLAARGVAVTGIEGSRHAIALSPVRDRIVRANIERGLPDLGRFDLCLCIEVAEHLPANRADSLVATLAGLGDVVVFTAAQPGQGGTHHVNEQPRSYWTERFRSLGYAVDTALEDALRESVAGEPEPAYLQENLIVVRRRVD